MHHFIADITQAKTPQQKERGDNWKTETSKILLAEGIHPDTRSWSTMPGKQLLGVPKRPRAIAAIDAAWLIAMKQHGATDAAGEARLAAGLNVNYTQSVTLTLDQIFDCSRFLLSCELWHICPERPRTIVCSAVLAIFNFIWLARLAVNVYPVQIVSQPRQAQEEGSARCVVFGSLNVRRDWGLKELKPQGRLL